MSRLHALLDDYLALRRGLGFKLREQRLLLPGFVDFVEQAGAESVTVELALAWAKTPSGVDPFRWKQRLSMVRGFAHYVHAFETRPPRYRLTGCWPTGVHGPRRFCFPTRRSPRCWWRPIHFDRFCGRSPAARCSVCSRSLDFTSVRPSVSTVTTLILLAVVSARALVSESGRFSRTDVFQLATPDNCNAEVSDSPQEVELLPSGDATPVRSIVALLPPSPSFVLGSFQDPRGAYCG